MRRASIFLSATWALAIAGCGSSTNEHRPDGGMQVETTNDGGTATDGAVAETGSSPSDGGSTDAKVAMPAPGTCVFTGSMEAARSFSLSGSLSDGRVLVAGGGAGETSAELYEPTTGKFTPTGSLTTFRWGYPNPLVKLQDGKFLVAGGTDPACMTVLSTAEIYDPVAGTWALTGSLVDPRSNPILVALGNGQVLVRGGYPMTSAGSCGMTSTNALTSAEIYDPVSGMFSLTGSAATPRAAAASTLLPSGDAFIVDGESFGSSPFNTTAEIYAPAVDGGAGAFTWSGTVPGTAGYPFAFTLPDGKVLVSGSYSGGTVSLFDPSTNTFAAATPDLISGGGGCGLQLKTGDVFLASGFGAGAQTTQTERYQASTGTWVQTGNLNVARSVCSIAELPDGNVLVAGGNDSTGNPLTSAEICNPNPPAAGTD